MRKAEQGDVLRVQGIRQLVLVVSNQDFNEIGEVMVCPLMEEIPQNAIHPEVIIQGGSSRKLIRAACEHIRHLDLNARSFVKAGSVDYFQMMDICDIIVSLVEYK